MRCLIASALFSILAITAYGNGAIGKDEPIVGPVVTISTGAGTPQHVWAYADPGDGHYLIVCGWLSDPSNNRLSGYVSTSRDGGATWRRTLFEHSTKFVSEEACAYGQHGKAYFAAGASNYYDGKPHHVTGHLYVYASDDHGMSWKRVWIRPQGWIDWTYLAVPPDDGLQKALIVFGNAATDRPGHWFPNSPVAIVSPDGGKSFTQAFSPRSDWVANFKYGGVFSGGATVLPNGTALFSASSWLYGPSTKAHQPSTQLPQAAEIFAYSPKNNSFRSRAVLGRTVGRGIFLAALAQDQHGRFKGRLYTAWVDNRKTESTLWLATSDDSGYRWAVRSILHGPGFMEMPSCGRGPIDQVALAVNRNGVLGLSWLENRSNVFLAISRDGGKTFGNPIVLAANDSNRFPQVPSEVITWNDYWLDALLTMVTGKQNPQWNWKHTLGLGVVMGRNTIANIALAADRTQRFHAFWIQPSGDTGVLVTRKLLARASSLLYVSNSCASHRANIVHPAIPPVQGTPALVLTGRRDVTSSIALYPTAYHYSELLHSITIDVQLVNKGKNALRAPVLLAGIGLHSDFGVPSATNATYYVDGQPIWDASSILPPGGLPPKAHSKHLHIAFVITKFQPLLSNYLEGDGVAMAVRIYQGSPKMGAARGSDTSSSLSGEFPIW